MLGGLLTTGCVDFQRLPSVFDAGQDAGTGVSSQGFVTAQSLIVSGNPTVAAPGERRGADLIRAPEIFQASTVAQWDGRRTARGVWVAHPDVRKPLNVRIVNMRTGTQIDGIAYRRKNSEAGDILTMSSDAAAALDLAPGKRERLTVFALRQRPAATQAQRSTAADSAQTELTSHIGRLPHNELLQLAAAAMRGMGYATAFDRAAGPDGLPTVRAFAQQGGGTIPAITVMVRPGTGEPMAAADVARHQATVAQNGGVGVIVSIPGFTADANNALTRQGSHVELVDLDGFMNIWLTHYEALSEPDRALLRLEPVYFLAGQ